MHSLSVAFDAVLSLHAVYVVTGLVLWIFAWLNLADRSNRHRLGTALFWFLLGLIFLTGSIVPHWVTGLLVLAMVGIDGAGLIVRSKDPGAAPSGGQAERNERTPGNRIFLLVLLIPLTTFAFALAFRWLGRNSNDGALVGLGYGGVVAMLVGLRLTKGRLREALQEGRRLNDAMGSVNILPQLLASLGLIFAASKIGDLIATGIQRVIPGQNLVLLIVANCLGMTMFTMVMGNSFAAFPVIASGVLVPLIIEPFDVNPAMVAILTLTAGSTGTLLTPMAANFNIVPTALLDMQDRYGVIKFQAPFALAIWTLHVVVMWLMIETF